jgi:hypothetical protein
VLVRIEDKDKEALECTEETSLHVKAVCKCIKDIMGRGGYESIDD